MVIRKKKATIWGISGQDGSGLADFLLEKEYFVIGISRRKSHGGNGRIKHLIGNKNFKLVQGDITDQSFVNRIIYKEKPQECYNLAAQSHVHESWNTPIETFEINTVGHLKLLEAIRQYSPKTKYYFAASSEMFGKIQEVPQKESTKFYPRSPYGCSKVASYWLTVNYRESYGIFACNGILFNHEGIRRSKEFVTRKITDGVARIKLGLAKKLRLGNLSSKRDWGDSKNYVEAMYLMLQQDKPDDYVIATNETHTVREFVEEAFKYADMEITWKGEGLNEKGYVNGKSVVIIDKKFFRPAEVDILIGDYSKAKKVLGWKPTTTFKQLVKDMVAHDILLLSKEKECSMKKISGF